jgi:hypothetical protein
MKQTRQKLTRELKRLRAVQHASRKAWKQAQRELQRLEKRTDRLLNRHLDACMNLYRVQQQLHAQGPAVVQTIVSAPAAPAEELSVERMAAHLGYGKSGRTRTELSKTLESGLSKVREKLKESL